MLANIEIYVAFVEAICTEKLCNKLFLPRDRRAKKDMILKLQYYNLQTLLITCNLV